MSIPLGLYTPLHVVGPSFYEISQRQQQSAFQAEAQLHLLSSPR